MTDEERLCEILARCRESAERGEAVDTAAIVREHPSLAGLLEARFDALRVLDRAYPPRRTAPGSAVAGPNLEGRRLGPYRLLEALGAGGMGSVWKAVREGVAGEGGLPGNDGPGEVVALKLLHPHLFHAPGFFDRFLREARVGQVVVHENVVRTFRADVQPIDGQDHHFLVMEHVEGQTLRGLLRELGRVPEELARHIGREMAKGLAAIHAAGIVHRDVKPENVLITKSHEVKLMDLGVARLRDEAVRLSQTGAFVGSLQYAAPEQFARGQADVDARADLHGLGLVLYELACGTNPFLADDVPQVVARVLHDEPRRLGEVDPQISPFFEELTRCLLQKDRARRFASAQALLAVLEAGEDHPWWKERARTLRLETRRPLRRIRIPRETAVYGREPELARLRELFEKARGGRGQVVWLEGEAGIGKSRLVDELVGRFLQEGEDLNFLHGSYAPGGAGTAAGAFSTAYREQLGAAGAREVLTRTPLLVAAFDALLSGDVTPPGVEPLTQASLQSCFVFATQALAVDRTTLILIDDLHFAPEEGLALFAALAHAVEGHRVLLIGTLRPGISEAWQARMTRLEHVHRMTLPRLGAKELVRLLEDAFHSQALASSLSAQIAVKSDGNPFFVFEIIRGLREGQFIARRDDGSWVSTRAIGEIKIPSSVLDLVNARVANLSAEERDLVDVACCAGFEFDPLLVGEVVGLARIPLLKRLSQIERRHRLVRSAGSRFVFDHHQVQEALYQGLPELLRQEFHGALATALEAREGAAAKEAAALAGATCVELCEHFLRGARGAEALRYLPAALAHLEGSYLNAAALALAERALAVPGLLTSLVRAKLLLRLGGNTLDLLGRRERQRSVCQEAEELALAGGDEALAGHAARALGVALCRTSEFEAAMEAFKRAQDIGRRLGDTTLECRATGSIGTVFFTLARFSEARECFDRCLAIARASHDLASEAIVTSHLGHALSTLGRFDEAREYHERHLKLSRELGDRRGETGAIHNLGGVEFATGRLDRGLELARLQLAKAQECGDRRAEGLAYQTLSTVSLPLGRLADGRAHAEHALAMMREIGDLWIETATLRTLADFHAEGGEVTEALVLVTQAITQAQAFGLLENGAQALRTRGTLLARLGRWDEARRASQEALEIAREHDLAHVVLLATADLACLPGGDAAAALAALETHEPTVEVLERLEGRYLVWKSTGDRAHLVEAKRWLDWLLENAPEDCRPLMRTNVGLHREILAAAAEAGL